MVVSQAARYHRGVLRLLAFSVASSRRLIVAACAGDTGSSDTVAPGVDSLRPELEATGGRSSGR